MRIRLKPKETKQTNQFVQQISVASVLFCSCLYPVPPLPFGNIISLLHTEKQVLKFSQINTTLL